MGRYTSIYNGKWNDPIYRKLDMGGKLLYEYILGATTGNQAGYYTLTSAQIKNDLCRYDNNSASGYNEEDEDFLNKKILPELTRQRKLWKYDVKTQQVLIPSYLKYNKQAGKSQIKGLVRELEQREISWLHIEFFYSAKTHLESRDFQLLLEMCSGQLIRRTNAIGRDICKNEEESTEGSLLKARTVIVLEELSCIEV